jgi:hypothetical protein
MNWSSPCANLAWLGLTGRILKTNGKGEIDSSGVEPLKVGHSSRRLPYQSTCFDAGSTELVNPPFSYESQRRVAAPFDTHAGPLDGPASRSAQKTLVRYRTQVSDLTRLMKSRKFTDHKEMILH